MKCMKCQYENEGGKFCENCGARLEGTSETEVAVSVEPVHQSEQRIQTNQYLETTKKISKQYFSYFMQVLKKPYASSKNVGSEHLVNGIITIVLYCLFIPLMTYFGVSGVLSKVNDFGSFLGTDLNIKPPFTDIVIKPVFAYVIFTLLVATYTFAAVKLGKVSASYKEVIARFGSFLIPFVLLLAIGFVMSILKMKLFILFLILGFIGSILVVPPLVIASYKKEKQEGLDVVYGTLLTYILIFITNIIMARILFEALLNSFSSIFDSL